MILKILDELKNNSSITVKRSILNREKDNDLFKKVLWQTLNPRIKYYIKKIPNHYPKGTMTLEEAINHLTAFSNRERTGNDASDFLQYLLSEVNSRDAQVLIKIIEKDLKCGVNASLVNGAFKDLIPETPYQGASGYNPKNLERMLKNGPVFSEIKMDGQYANCIITDSVYLESRSGNTTNLGSYFDDLIFLKEYYGEIVLNGEFVMRNVDRYTSNGMINSLVSIHTKMSEGKDVTKEAAGFFKTHGMSITEALNNLEYVVWDVIPYTSYLKGSDDTQRYVRLENVQNIVDSLMENSIQKVSCIQFKQCSTKEQVFKHFQDLLSKGEEGTIVKEYNAPWTNGKPKTQMKFKLELDLDLILVGFNEGSKNTKFEGKYSSIKVETGCAKLSTNPAGINEDTVDYITDNSDKLLGSIVTVTCSGLSKDREGNYSLLHPRFKCFREDKHTPDTLEDCIAKENSKKGL